MNTRLQVEHPVTEMITGLDLVEVQLLVAMGYSLAEQGLVQANITRQGYAIECRLCAEDPQNNFMPSTGKILLYSQGSNSEVRYDTGVASGNHQLHLLF